MGPEHASHTPLLGLVLLEGGGGTPQKHTTETAGRTTQATYAACHTQFAAMLGAFAMLLFFGETVKTDGKTNQCVLEESRFL